MFKASVAFDLDVHRAVYETAVQAPAAMRREAGKVARGATAQKLIVALSTEPGPPVYPMQWTSPRQRRYVMALLRRTNNLPYKRTHKLAQGWRVVLLQLSNNEGIFGVENSNRAADFVQGERMQIMHKNTGWPEARKEIRNFAEPLQDELINAWFRATQVGR